MNSGLFASDAAATFISQIRNAAPTTVGDSISAALRAVAQREGTLTADEATVALAAAALLLSESDSDALTGLDDPDGVADWFADLDVELNPARLLVAEGAIRRILLADDNEWYQRQQQHGRLAESLVAVRHLEDLLTDAD